MEGLEEDRQLIRKLAEWAGKSPSDLAKSAGLTPSTLTRPLKHEVKHRLSEPTRLKLRMRYPQWPGWNRNEPDLPASDEAGDYCAVRILPTFAGMGGGGTGDEPGNEEHALVARALIEDILRGRATDFLLIRVRGDSMEPDFRHGDELLVDRRDQSPAQPGPFAIWDGEWGEYVVKNVERMPEGRVRMFSSNPKYSPAEVQHEETRIIGRPVWFGRRL